MSSLKTQMSKAAKYCSKECQKADWKNHKQNCQNNASLADALKDHAASPLGMIERLMLPDGISLYDLDQRLEKWVRFHNPTLMGATIHALRLPESLARARTHVLHIELLPRWDHGGAVGKYFRVVRTKVVEVAQAQTWAEPWPASLSALREMQDQSESMRRGYVAAAMVESPPLAVQTVPFGSIKKLDYPVVQRWEEVLIKDVEAGRKFGKPA
ncbi:predicted protein [Postia placenta Mad-698-R]|uniref:MYND-type domain-containing protein n=1 Tax=Postia placenta MAD-698-R-SB12 TaxID=670580 RepID=A0A1X6MRW9_9APHY|nr:hypothetical protein POSPLADRAFT_1151641 [Postia placenta MAD-698-R-SB12]EED79095.1 predicted protein [Postia placenta Mad-698-R]OSX59115.1 hypothetical protein POSPLADRAFT_1151641 [Postia placenta MAD-698-R-SB12]